MNENDIPFDIWIGFNSINESKLAKAPTPNTCKTFFQKYFPRLMFTESNTFPTSVLAVRDFFHYFDLSSLLELGLRNLFKMDYFSWIIQTWL